MYSSPRHRPLGRAVPLIALLALACDGGSSPSAPDLQLATCNVIAPIDVGQATLLRPGTDCLSLTQAAEYALAYFDPRFVDAAKTEHEAFAPDLGDVTVKVGWAGDDRFEVGVTGSRTTSRDRLDGHEVHRHADDWIRIIPNPNADGQTTNADWPTTNARRVGDGDPDSAGNPPAAGPAAQAMPCDVGPALALFCQPHPWEVGDTLTIPEPFGLLIHETPRAAEVLVVRDPFVFAVNRDMPESERARLRPILAQMAHVASLRVLPFLKRALIDKDVYTSAGSRQILIDTTFDEDAICICGIAVGTYAQGESVSGVSIRIPAGQEFVAHRVGLFAHELTHVWQHAFDTERVGNPTEAVAPNTRWAVEGGADFVRQEVLRSLASEPLDGNRDTSFGFIDPYLDRLVRDFGAATGHVRAGYAQTAGLLRHLFVRALDSGAGYDEALQSIMQGSLEGWFGSPDGTVSGAGLRQRLEAFGPSFDPTQQVLEYAIANAVDDRLESPVLRNPAVLEAWRRSTGSRFVPAARIVPNGPGVRVRQPAGSVGYVYVNNAPTDEILQFTSTSEDVRWMVIRFK